MQSLNRFLIILVCIMLSFVAYAADASIPPANANTSTVLVMLFNGFINVGCLFYLAKKYMKTTDLNSESIIKICNDLVSGQANMKAHRELIEAQTASLKVVLEKSHCYEVRLTEIETVHKLKGCDVPNLGVGKK